RDNGVGTPSDMLPKVFGLFAQVEGQVGRSAGGLGIGLSLVRRLVTMHEGTVEAFSGGPGAGSEFVVTLPLLSGEPPEPPRPGPAEWADPPSPVLAARRILVVDDNREFAEALRDVLAARTGSEVRMAGDGPE